MGTHVTRDIGPGTATGDYALYPAAPFLGGVLFGGYDPTNGFEPFLSDGTSGGTVPLATVFPGGRMFTSGFFANGAAGFYGSDAATAGGTDSGLNGSPPSDGGGSSDGCGCRVGPSRVSSASMLAGLGLLFAGLCRRRRVLPFKRRGRAFV